MDLKPEEKVVTTWQEYVAFVTRLRGRWHFRGVRSDWALEPTLERVARHWDIKMGDLPQLERRLVREFRRDYPTNGTEPPPRDDDTLGWLALMQHYGAPTRLLDWTYSPFTAAFFALDVLLSEENRSQKAAVWALSNVPTENQKIQALLPAALQADFKTYSVERQGKAFRTVFCDADPRVAFVTPVNPYKRNQRLVLQQGLFLCPGDISRSFEDNLQAVPEANDAINLKKILLPRSVLEEAFTDLQRMNISHSTLFPGIEGYSRSLRQRVKFLMTGGFFDATMWA